MWALAFGNKQTLKINDVGRMSSCWEWICSLVGHDLQQAGQQRHPCNPVQVLGPGSDQVCS